MASFFTRLIRRNGGLYTILFLVTFAVCLFLILDSRKETVPPASELASVQIQKNENSLLPEQNRNASASASVSNQNNNSADDTSQDVEAGSDTGRYYR